MNRTNAATGSATAKASVHTGPAVEPARIAAR
jgi:hypothetical protein